MKYIILEEFPEGNFNIPLKESGEQAVFDEEEIEEAIILKHNLQNSRLCVIRD